MYENEDIILGKLKSAETSLGEKVNKNDISVSVKDFKCTDGQYVTGDGTHDDTTGIQATIDYVYNTYGNGIVSLAKNGLYKITSTLNVPIGISIQGEYAGVEENYPTLTWYGAAGETMVQVGDGTSQNLHEQPFKRFNMRGKGRYASNSADNAFIFKNRCDLGVYFTDTAFHNFNSHALVFQKGGLNVHCRNFRVDSTLGKAFYWTLGGIDYLSIDGFTADYGGVLELDTATASENWKLNFSISNSKIEVNSPMTNEGCFVFNINKNLGTRKQFSASFINTHVVSSTTYTGIYIKPAHFFADIVLINSTINLKGADGWSHYNTGEYHSFTIISPQTVSGGLGTAGDRTIATINSDLNVDNLFQHGKKVRNIFLSNGSDFTENVNLVVGDCIFDPAQSGQTVRKVKEVVDGGTVGTLTSVTGTIANASTQLVLNDSSQLRVGNIITIGGVMTKKIVDINHDTKTATLSSASNADYTNANVTFYAPVYIEYQLLTKKSSAPTTGTYVIGDIVFNSSPSEQGTAGSKYIITGWQCTGAGTPGTWLPLRTLTGN